MKKNKKKNTQNKKTAVKVKPEELQAFDTIDIESISANIAIKAGKHDNFALSNKNKVPIEYNVKDETLSIIQKSDSSANRITIIVPKANEIKLIKASLVDGDLSLKGLKVDEANFVLDNGSLSIKDCEIESGSAKLDKGLLDAENADLNSFSFYNDAGKEEKSESADSQE